MLQLVPVPVSHALSINPWVIWRREFSSSCRWVADTLLDSSVLRSLHSSILVSVRFHCFWSSNYCVWGTIWRRATTGNKIYTSFIAEIDGSGFKGQFKIRTVRLLRSALVLLRGLKFIFNDYSQTREGRFSSAAPSSGCHKMRLTFWRCLIRWQILMFYGQVHLSSIVQQTALLDWDIKHIRRFAL